MCVGWKYYAGSRQFIKTKTPPAAENPLPVAFIAWFRLPHRGGIHPHPLDAIVGFVSIRFISHEVNNF